METLRPEQKTISSPPRPKTQVISIGNKAIQNFNSPIKPVTYPPILWVIGGPGSNKASLCASAAREIEWTHISLGKLLRTAAESSNGQYNNETNKLKDCISGGELVPFDIVMKYIENQINNNIEAKGIILDGFPRDMDQVTEFEQRFKQRPTIILLDCSKLQLGKGRLDDSVTAFRRRLEIFRQSSLPMLKAMDNVGRLTIVDGDTDTAPVREDFKNVVSEHVTLMLTHLQQSQPTAQIENTYYTNGYITSNNGYIPSSEGFTPNGAQNGHILNGDATLHDLENESGHIIDTVSQRVRNGVANGVANGIHHMGIGTVPVTAQKTNGVASLKNGVIKMLNGYTKTPHIGNVGRNIPVFKSLENGHVNGTYNEVNFMDSHI